MGALNILSKTAKAASEADKALPLRLGRATPKTQAEIDALATRVSKQMLGEHVVSGKPKDTKNLAGRSMKESKRLSGLDYVVEPTGAAKESVIYQPRKGDVNVAIPGDQTISDSILRRVGDIEGIDSHQQGGARYGLGKMDMEDPLFWASGESAAQNAQNKFTSVGEFFDPERVVGQHMAMGPVSNNFAMHFADATLRAMDYSKIKPKDMQTFDRIIADGYMKKNQKTQQYEHINFPDWPGIADPEAAMAAMRDNPEMRKWYLSRMKTPDVTQPLGLPNGLDIQWAITEPQLRNMEINLTGLSAGEMVPGAKLTDTAAHNTYDKGIRGKALGHQEVLTPFTLSFPDAAQHIASTKNPADFTGTIQKVFPHQIVDDQWLDEVAKYRELIKKYTGQKKGGEIHMSNFEKRIRGIKDEDGKASMRKVMAMMSEMIKGQPQSVKALTLKGRKYAQGGATESKPIGFRRGGGSNKDKPMYEAFTQGLGPMLYGAARGTAAGLTGVAGDIEELGRMGINWSFGPGGVKVDEKAKLPTTEDMLKKIPSLKDLGAGKEAQHSEDIASGLGAYGVSQIVGPKVGKTLVKGAKTLGKEMGELAGHKIATGQSLIPGIPASLTNPPVMNIIKPEGGNWMKGTLDTDLKPLKRNTPAGNDAEEMYKQMKERYTPEEIEKLQGQTKANIIEQMDTLEKMAALNKWVDSNLKNYVKKQMATPSDPVRKLAEEGIVHMPTNEVGRNRWAGSSQRSIFKGEQLGKSEAAKAWEDATDVAIRPVEIQDLPKEHFEPWMTNAPPDTRVSYLSRDFDTQALGFDHIMDVLRQDLVSGRIRPEQLNKVSMEQAVRRTAEYDQDMAKEMQRTALQRQEGFPVHKEYPEGYKWIELTKPKHEVLEENLPAGYKLRKSDAPFEHQRWQVVDEQGLPAAEYVQANFNYSIPDPKLKALENFFDKKSNKQLKDALDYEGKAMGHCVGSYCDEVSEGNKKIYTLRDAKGEPHVTVEVVPSDNAQQFYEANKKALDNPVFKRELDMMIDPDSDVLLADQYVNAARKLLTENGIKFNEPTPLPPVIKQIKGKQNRAPESKYQPYVQDFVRSSNWTDVGDLKNTGLKTLDQAFPNYEDVKYFSNANPKTKYVTQAEIDAHNLQVNQDLINEYGSHRIKPDPQSKTTYGRTDFMTAKELAELEFPGDLERQANMIRGAMQGTTEPGAYSGTLHPPLAEKRGGAISLPKYSLKLGTGGLLKGIAKMSAKEEALSKLPQMKKELATRQALEAQYKQAMRDVPYDKQVTLKAWEEAQKTPAKKTVWHGSPHHFPPTKTNPLGAFDPTKIGSGEGTQAYGYGHYLAEAKGNAEGYRHMLSVDPSQGSENIKYATLEQFMPNEAPAVQKQIKDFLDGTGNYADFVRVVKQQGSDNFKKALVSEEPELFKAGALYQVELPEEHLANMLDYDLPWSQQPEIVKKAIDVGGLQKFYNSEDIPVSQILYHAQQSMTPEKFAEFMRSKGVPGIKYKDAQSRGIREAEEGTRNIVIFPGNEELLNIVGKEKRGGLIHMRKQYA
jgi:hypothetical protein